MDAICVRQEAPGVEVPEVLLPQGDAGKKDKPDVEDEAGYAESELAAGELRFLGDGTLTDETKVRLAEEHEPRVPPPPGDETATAAPAAGAAG
jgi:hypothetical protein